MADRLISIFAGFLKRVARTVVREVVADVRCFIPAGRLFLDTHGFDHAAAISFYFILSLAPFIILLVSATGYVAGHMGPDSAQMQAIIEKLATNVSTYIPVESATLHSIVDYLISRKVSLGIAGTVILIIGASAIFGAIENASADIFRRGQRRWYLASRLVFVVVLATAGLLGFMLYNAVTLVQSFIDTRLAGSFINQTLNRSTFRVLFELVPVPIGFLILLYAPGIARPRFAAALRGAILYFLLWTVVREAYAGYVTTISDYSLLYGSLATPILLVLWLFYSALILLYCMCFAAVSNGGVVDNS